MDLTPDALRETTFRGALRGYNVDDVDEFVEKVAVGMAELLDQLRQASERAVAAERRAKEVASSEDAMRRTLGHAQKLAEAVLAEARQEAARLTEEARQKASRLRGESKDAAAAERAAGATARAEGERLRAEAAADRQASRASIEAEQAAAREQLDVMAASAAERIDVDLQAEIHRLHGARQALQLDVAVLTSWMHDQRDSVRNVLVETLAALDRAAPVDDPPPVSDVDTTVRLAGSSIRLQPVADPPPPPPEAVIPPPPLLSAQPSAAPSDEPPPPGPADPASGRSPDRLDRRVDPSPEERPPVTFPDLSDEEFLAELKKAAAGGDDSLFGPGDQGLPS